jgi:hypothetical protein
MKCMLSIMFIVITATVAYGGVANDANQFCLAVIIDRSASSQWSQIPLVAGQAITVLREAELLKVITAETDQPILHASSKIGYQQTPSRTDIYAFLTRLKAIPWGGQADIARSVSAAFGELDRCGPLYKCALLVVTDGKLSDSQMRQIRNLASAYKAKGWDLCVTADNKAHSDLFLAASQGEFQVMLLEHANVSSWIESVRPVVAKNTANNTMAPPSLPPVPKRQSIPKSPDYPMNRTADSNQLKMLKTLQQDINEVKTNVKKIAENSPESHKPVNDLPLPPAKQDSQQSNPPKTGGTAGIADGNGSTFSSGVKSVVNTSAVPDNNTSERAKSNKTDEKAVSAHNEKSESIIMLLLSWLKKHIWWIILATGSVLAALAIIIMACIYTKDRHVVEQTRNDLNSQVKAEDRPYQQLICYVGEQRFDIGDLNSFREVVIGSGMGCTIFIDNEAVEAHHLKVINTSDSLQVKNLASKSIHVNGTCLGPNKSCSLSLPADITLAPEISLTLILETVELEVEVAHEQKID